MKNLFDQATERRGTGCVKWDAPIAAGAPEDFIPVWVADMDFPTAPAVRRAVEQRAAQGIFGYTFIGESYYQSIVSWFRRRHGWEIERQEIIYIPSVVPAISSVVQALTMPGEQVLMLSPVYNCFFSSVRNSGCQVQECPLIYRDCRYEIDWEHFEACCSQEKTTVFLLCSPHNPAGRLWTAEELGRMNAICLRHGVKVISDEIHCELVMPGGRFVPFAAVSTECRANAVVLNSPSKAFNTAGLMIANIICANPEWRRRINRIINNNELCDINPFGPAALEAAYNEGEEWLEALCSYIKDNYDYLCGYLSEECPDVAVTRLEATYLAWLDIRALGVDTDALSTRLINEAHVKVSPGTLYGPVTGEGFLRVNLATQRERLAEALRRLAPLLKK